MRLNGMDALAACDVFFVCFVSWCAGLVIVYIIMISWLFVVVVFFVLFCFVFNVLREFIRLLHRGLAS